MTHRKTSAFVPCRAGSERVKHKNTRDFAGVKGGLLAIKLAHLDASRKIDDIIVSSNDPIVLDIASTFSKAARKPVVVSERPEHLSTAATSIVDLTLHACDLAGDGVVAWAHVTSPLVGAGDYDAMIAAYENALGAGTHDSLMTVTVMHKFLWNAAGPLNYKPHPLKWPRTQDIPAVFEINSASFIADVETCRANNDRVGVSPLLFEMAQWKSIDVDWDDDFAVAELLYKRQLA
jgi:CMP-N-acetylneuraminic acid synthetase